jgi:hypothetical protein
MHERRSLRLFRSPLVFVLLFALSLPAITHRLNASDEVQFFAWLRSWSFDRDADFANEYRHFYDGALHNTGFHETFLERLNENGRPDNFAPVGTAILWSPFYAAAHVIAGITGAAQDGYSQPYITAVTTASAFYGLLSLLLSQAFARRVLGSSSIEASLAVWFGTPLIFYMYVAPGFGHACSAFAVSLFLWTWLRVRDDWTPAGALQLGLTGALLPMVREQDFVFLVGPALDFIRWSVRRYQAQPATGASGSSTARRSSPIVAALVGVTALALAYMPQLVAYQALNGHPGPARVVSRKMTWNSPHFLGVILSPKHGFFIWTPLALLALAGLVWLAVMKRPPSPTPPDRPAGMMRDAGWVAQLCLVMFVLQIYVSGSVESWTVAGSFGQRRFVALTPLLVLGLAGVVQAAAGRRWRRSAVTAVLLLGVWWNLGLMAQFGLHLMDRQQLTPAENARVTFLQLPFELPSVVWRYLFHRESFFGLPRG